ncbi:ATP-dependent nuclease [Bacillus cereus]|uniref:ATP-dependent nuclease n=1 Tax=Bacillus cereus TaxID=1396 RepID=UPI000BF96D87|nr:AAA family ATPase [Bacillus cereus]PFS47132.1 hypothetical protein COK44_17335 [Bacillus cereus]
MSKIINDIFLTNYRGFKEECKLSLTEANNITFLVGPNNSGKSLITRVFSVFKHTLEPQQKNYFSVKDFRDNDYFLLNIEEPVQIKLSINIEAFQDRKEIEFIKLKRVQSINLCIEIRKLQENFYGCVFISREEDRTHCYNEEKKCFEFLPGNKLSEDLGMDKNQTEEFCKMLYSEIQNRILVFDSIRSFDREQSDFYRNGSELIEWLTENKHVAQITRARKTVRKWLRECFNLDDPSAVKVDSQKKQLIFTFEDLELSSSEIGTGYTMLYILLMEIVRNNKDLVIIDEIESHLQPGLIRVLIKIIRNHGNSQYLIATHSATVMESASENDILYRFNKKDGICTFQNFFRNAPEGMKMFREVCNELGVIPGDALLCNVVIWVEGPSEVFWMRTWLKNYFEIYKKDKRIKRNLIEGLHYTILMTGGSNISHYSFEEKETPLEMIEEDHMLKVLKVNPNPFVMIDSDAADKSSAKYKRMMRIANELNEVNKLHPKFSHSAYKEVIEENLFNISNLWLLKGRELENYAHPQLIKDFYTNRAEHPKSKITGAKECSNWDVFDSKYGSGKILEGRGITNIAAKSGTIAQKNDFSRFIFHNFKPIHFELKPNGIEQPNEEMIKDLTGNLDKLISYILAVNEID